MWALSVARHSTCESDDTTHQNRKNTSRHTQFGGCCGGLGTDPGRDNRSFSAVGPAGGLRTRSWYWAGDHGWNGSNGRLSRSGPTDHFGRKERTLSAFSLHNTQSPS